MRAQDTKEADHQAIGAPQLSVASEQLPASSEAVGALGFPGQARGKSESGTGPKACSAPGL